jgi:hypothetical protein
LSNDGLWNSEFWESYETAKTWVLDSAQGEKTVYYQIKDKAGLISPTYLDKIFLTNSSSVSNPTPSPSPSPTLQPTQVPELEEQPIPIYFLLVAIAFVAIGISVFIIRKR